MSNLEIFNKLHEKINIVTAGNGSQNSSYGEAREILVKSDVEPGKETLFGIYDNAEIPADWGSGNVFQREHVWPNSKLGIEGVSNSSRDQGSDPHNLRAIVGSTNASRSNRYYAAGSELKDTQLELMNIIREIITAEMLQEFYYIWLLDIKIF